MRLLVLVIAVSSALFFRFFLISVYKVSTQSMAPALMAGDYILASKISFGMKTPWSGSIFFKSTPEVGDLIVYHKNSKVFVKRVLATALSEVEYSQGSYLINGNKCQYEELGNVSKLIESGQYKLFTEICGSSQKKIIKLADGADKVQIPRQKLAENQYFVASDFRNFESDLSNAEAITFDQIIGKPMFIWMSYSSMQDFISDQIGIRWNRIMTML